MKTIKYIIIVLILVLIASAFYFLGTQNLQAKAEREAIKKQIEAMKQKEAIEYKQIKLPLPNMVISDVTAARVLAVNCDRIRDDGILTCNAKIDYEVQEVK